jgi:hypothetical protein
MILLFNRHSGLVINCGKAIDEKLKKELDESSTIETDIYRPVIDFLRYSFAGFLGSMQINDSEEIKKAGFLTTEGVLTVVSKDDNIYRMSSAFMDELMRRQVISKVKKKIIKRETNSRQLNGIKEKLKNLIINMMG